MGKIFNFFKHFIWFDQNITFFSVFYSEFTNSGIIVVFASIFFDMLYLTYRVVGVVFWSDQIFKNKQICS